MLTAEVMHPQQPNTTVSLLDRLSQLPGFKLCLCPMLRRLRRWSWFSVLTTFQRYFFERRSTWITFHLFSNYPLTYLAWVTFAEVIVISPACLAPWINISRKQDLCQSIVYIISWLILRDIETYSFLIFKRFDNNDLLNYVYQITCWIKYMIYLMLE
jgi:hypothetical protein